MTRTIVQIGKLLHALTHTFHVPTHLLQVLKNIGVMDGVLTDLQVKRRSMFEERESKIHRKAGLERDLQQVLREWHHFV